MHFPTLEPSENADYLNNIALYRNMKTGLNTCSQLQLFKSIITGVGVETGHFTIGTI